MKVTIRSLSTHGVRRGLAGGEAVGLKGLGSGRAKARAARNLAVTREGARGSVRAMVPGRTDPRGAAVFSKVKNKWIELDHF